MKLTLSVFLAGVCMGMALLLAPAAAFDGASEARIMKAGYIQIAEAAYQVERGQGNTNIIPPSVALRLAIKHAPGSEGLGIRLLTGQRLIYAVKLRYGDQVSRVLVDAKTGAIIGE